MKKLRIISVLLACIIAMSVVFTGCGESDESKALKRVNAYVEAMELGDETAMMECYDPNIQNVSNALSNTLSSLFGISNGAELGLGAGTILNQSLMDASSVDISYKYVDIYKNELTENDGKLSVKYEMTITLKDDTSKSEKVLIMIPFNMIKHDNEWYITSIEDALLLTDAEGNEIKPPKMQIDEGRKFSDGVAWVKSNDIWQCIDKSGEILFKLEAKESPKTDFVNGIAVVAAPNLYYYVINTKGEIVISPEKQGFDKIILKYEDSYSKNDTPVWDGKVVLVQKSNSTYAKSEVQVGVLDGKGNWISRLSTDNPMVTQEKDGVRVSTKAYQPKNSNEPIWILLNEESTIYENAALYCPELNKTIPLKDDNINFSMEKTKGVIFSNSGIYSITESGASEKPILERYVNMKEGKYANEVFYAEQRFSGGKIGFFDLTGNCVIDLSKYGYISNVPCFEKGKAVIAMTNPAYETYFTVIDNTGKEMLEPHDCKDIVIRSGNIIETFVSGYVSANGKKAPRTYYDLNGNELFKDINGEISNINEDIAMVTTDTVEGIYYVDINSNRLF